MFCFWLFFIIFAIIILFVMPDKKNGFSLRDKASGFGVNILDFLDRPLGSGSKATWGVVLLLGFAVYAIICFVLSVFDIFG